MNIFKILVLTLSLSLPFSSIYAEIRDVDRALITFWKGLKTGNLVNCPESYPYFPHSGPQQFACYLLSIHSLPALLKFAPPVFLSGPHQSIKGKITYQIDHPLEFAYYNPKFLEWGIREILPTLTHPIVVKSTRSSYLSHLKPVLSTLYVTRKKMEADPNCVAKEIRRYKHFLSAKRSGASIDIELSDMPTERYYDFLNPSFCTRAPGQVFEFDYQSIDRYDGNMVKGCVSWWIRRTLDGTAPLFKEILTQLVQAYDPELIHEIDPVQKAQDDQRRMSEFRKEFEHALRLKNYAEMIKLMDAEYVRNQHDQMLKGNTVQFIDEQFCGRQKTLPQIACLKLSEIESFEQIDQNFDVKSQRIHLRYQFTGFSKDKNRKITIFTEFDLIESTLKDGKKGLRIYGAEG